MNLQINKTLNVTPIAFIEHSNAQANFSGGFNVIVPFAGSPKTLVVPQIPTISVRQLVIGIDPQFPGQLYVRKYFNGGSSFIDDPLTIIAAGTTMVIDTVSLLDSVEIWVSNTGIADLPCRVTAIGRS